MISIIVPSYKKIELLSNALNSIIKQQYSDYEIIIVDDTPDNSIEEYCKDLGYSEVRYHHNNPPKGAIDNWNYGLSLAEGNKVILLHHDESFCNDDYLYRLDKLLDNYDVVISNKKVIVASGFKKERFPNWIKRPFIFLKYPLFAINVIGPCACVAFRKEIMQEFDNRMHWKVDIDWYYRILRKAKTIIYIDSEEIISHHGHEEQITNNINIKEVSAADSKIIKSKYKNIKVDFCLWIGEVLSKLK